MKILADNILCLEFEDMVNAAVAVIGKDREKYTQYLWKAKSAGTKGYGFLKDPDDGRKVLFQYDKMNDANQLIVREHFGDPLKYIALAPLRIALLKPDHEALDYYLNFTYGTNNTKRLSDDLIKKYTKAATVLKNLAALMDDKKAIKKQFKCDITTFTGYVIDIIKQEKVDLPESYQRIFGKGKDLGALPRFREQGYRSVIDWRIGNELAKKVNDQVLKSLLEHPYQYDDATVRFLYNGWVSQNGGEEISVRIIALRRKEWADEITPGREGWNAFNEKFVRQVKGLPADCMHPLALVECDDYNFNYYYSDPDFQGSAKDLQRYVGYIVADSSLGLILGASYRAAKAPVFEMVRIAWIDAMYYIRSLAGDGNWYLPFEVKADHWNRDNAFPFFQSIGNFVAPALKNKHRGYIEQLFGSPHAKRAEKLAAHDDGNYNGNNLTARNRGVNPEYLKEGTKHRPLIGDQACEQINRFLYYMRHLPAFTKDDQNVPSREVMWKERWKGLTTEQKRPITDMQFLHLFGIKHEPQGRAITITNRGVEPVINGVQYSYDLPDYTTMQHLIGSKVWVVYDPYDMSRVLITDYENIRFIAKSAVLQPRALVYQYDGSRRALNAILAEKKQQVELTAGKKNGRMLNIDPKAIMLGGMMPKELLADAEQNYRELEAGSPIQYIPDFNTPEPINEIEEVEFNIHKAKFNR
jgi:hypothetical protein